MPWAMKHFNVLLDTMDLPFGDGAGHVLDPKQTTTQGEAM